MMPNLINYTANGANDIKNWDLMTRAAPTKLSVDKSFRFWPFHEMFMNHIENMGWITSLVFTESGTDYNIAKDFGQVRIQTIDTDYQALEIANQPTDNIKNSNYATSTLGFSTQATNRLYISFPKKATIIINPDLWPGSYLPQRFYAAPNKESSVKKYDPYTFLREF